MNHEERVNLLNRWEKRIVQLDAQLDKVAELFGAASDNSPLIKEICKTQSEYSRAIAELVGDNGDWLFSWHVEWGMKGCVLNAQVGDVDMPARTIEDLANIIEVSRQQESA